MGTVLHVSGNHRITKSTGPVLLLIDLKQSLQRQPFTAFRTLIPTRRFRTSALFAYLDLLHHLRSETKLDRIRRHNASVALHSIILSLYQAAIPEFRSASFFYQTSVCFSIYLFFVSVSQSFPTFPAEDLILFYLFAAVRTVGRFVFPGRTVHAFQSFHIIDNIRYPFPTFLAFIEVLFSFAFPNKPQFLILRSQKNRFRGINKRSGYIAEKLIPVSFRARDDFIPRHITDFGLHLFPPLTQIMPRDNLELFNPI